LVLSHCSIGGSMFRPTDSAPASRAPRLAAYMVPGPPPVTMAYPAVPTRARVRGQAVVGVGVGESGGAEQRVHPPERPAGFDAALHLLDVRLDELRHRGVVAGGPCADAVGEAVDLASNRLVADEQVVDGAFRVWV
jgi:hypothetical protein